MFLWWLLRVRLCAAVMQVKVRARLCVNPYIICTTLRTTISCDRFMTHFTDANGRVWRGCMRAYVICNAVKHNAGELKWFDGSTHARRRFVRGICINQLLWCAYVWLNLGDREFCDFPMACTLMRSEWICFLCWTGWGVDVFQQIDVAQLMYTILVDCIRRPYMRSTNAL